MTLNEAIVEEAALDWFHELGCAVLPGTQMAPCEPASARDSFSNVVLVEMLRDVIRQVQPITLRRAPPTLHTTVLPKLLSGGRSCMAHGS
jgi:hypothetical protein